MNDLSAGAGVNCYPNCQGQAASRIYISYYEANNF